MKKNNSLLIILFLVTTLNGQDKLITLSGIEYSGKYIGQTNDKIEFIQAGKTNSVLVPKESVQAIILENLKIVDIQLVQGSNENQIAIDKDDKHKDGMPTLNANDKLTTISGKVYLGKFISVENDKVKFIQGGFVFPSFIPDHTVRSVVLSDGTVVYGKGASEQDDTDSVSDVMAISSGYNPCEDERYLQIKEKPLDKMSDREYNYFLSIDKECKEYLSNPKTRTTVGQVNTVSTSGGKMNSSSVNSKNIATVTEMVAYGTMKKDPALAGLLSFFIPTAGHAYAGDWERGVLFFIGKILTYAFMIGGIEEKTETIEVFGPDITNTYLEYTAQYQFGGFLLVALSVAEIADAVSITNKHNAKLQESISN